MTSSGRKERATGWKCFHSDLTCRSHKFEIGGTYEVSGAPELCNNGFHFHEAPSEIFNYYVNSVSHTRVCEVVAEDVVTSGDKSAARRITVVRELAHHEVCRLLGGNGNGNGNGNGYGYGNGYGNGYGYGNGNGNGYGNGNGNGYGNGNGNGNGNGYGNSNRFSPLPDFIEFATTNCGEVA